LRCCGREGSRRPLSPGKSCRKSEASSAVWRRRKRKRDNSLPNPCPGASTKSFCGCRIRLSKASGEDAEEAEWVREACVISSPRSKQPGRRRSHAPGRCGSASPATEASMSSGFVGGRLIPLALNPISVAHDGERRRCCGPTEMRDAAEPAPGRRITCARGSSRGPRVGRSKPPSLGRKGAPCSDSRRT
jgi:hypothetical protein